MKRREFIALLGGSALAGPNVGRAQPRTPTIGFISSASPTGFAFYVAAFRDGLKKAGYFEGWNIAVEYRWAEGRSDRLPALVADLIEHKVGAIFADAQAALAAKAATTTVPIVFSCAGDPLKLGLLRSLDKPDGNVTGVSFPVAASAIKRLQMLHTIAPNASSIGYLSNPDNPRAEGESKELQSATLAFGLTFRPVQASGADELDKAFASLAQARVDAMVVGADEKFIASRDQIIAAAARRQLPALYNLRPWTLSGGLMSYGPDIEAANRQCGAYVARVLKGGSVNSLAVIQSQSIKLVVNLRTAKALALPVPRPVIFAADELIE